MLSLVTVQILQDVYLEVYKRFAANFYLTDYQCCLEAAQAAEVSVNGKHMISHMGGYTPFVIPLDGELKVGTNTIDVMCDNHEDVNLIPVASDFNKNNGLHNPAYFLQMNSVYFSAHQQKPVFIRRC